MIQPHVSEPELVVLHSLRCIGFAGEERIASASGVGVLDVVTTLHVLANDGLVSRHDGPFGGWNLTEDGRRKDAEWVTAELTTTGTREEVERAYRAFLELNSTLLAVCHAWQVHERGVALPNDHRDADYDIGVIDRLAAVDRSVQPTLDSLSERLARFSNYPRRLRNAMQRVDAGDHAFFTEGLESYHTVWFQLHEDLLATLGIERWSEQ